MSKIFAPEPRCPARPPTRPCSGSSPASSSAGCSRSPWRRSSKRPGRTASRRSRTPRSRRRSASRGWTQRTLAATIGFDTSTIGGVIDRLEKRALIERRASPADRRVRLLHVTPAGDRLLADVVPGMLRAQQRILAPLPEADRGRFPAMLRTVVEADNASSRAPSAI